MSGGWLYGRQGYKFDLIPSLAGSLLYRCQKQWWWFCRCWQRWQYWQQVKQQTSQSSKPKSWGMTNATHQYDSSVKLFISRFVLQINFAIWLFLTLWIVLYLLEASLLTLRMTRQAFVYKCFVLGLDCVFFFIIVCLSVLNMISLV